MICRRTRIRRARWQGSGNESFRAATEAASPAFGERGLMARIERQGPKDKVWFRGRIPMAIATVGIAIHFLRLCHGHKRHALEGSRPRGRSMNWGIRAGSGPPGERLSPGNARRESFMERAGPLNAGRKMCSEDAEKRGKGRTWEWEKTEGSGWGKATGVDVFGVNPIVSLLNRIRPLPALYQAHLLRLSCTDCSRAHLFFHIIRETTSYFWGGSRWLELQTHRLQYFPFSSVDTGSGEGSSLNSIRTPPVDRGWRKAMQAPPAP